MNYLDKYIEKIKALSDLTRIRILKLLLEVNNELCVCEITDALGENQYKISKHMRVLKNAKLVRERREGKWVIYSIIPDTGMLEKNLFNIVKLFEGEIFEQDKLRLKARLSLRVKNKCVIGMDDERWKQKIKELKWEVRNA
ncbi:MAG TPA: metalloregulator ArsR/SmtB family transcription factor [candidate division WOR-3 bacterium]|uniref:Metalloregulator ArsR/SmtB family transcription factor n=1 Tax=candidate division WOR-3 bacterium TaxID=2052148 RepID=A0A7V5LU41_UNCW3|nr:metalloregulator ArsR/SmtB family transcription factor [candidate division WOR-3 bacterium]